MVIRLDLSENDSQWSAAPSSAAESFGNGAADELPVLGPRATLDDPAVPRGIQDWLGPGLSFEDLGGSVNLNVKITNEGGVTALVRVHRPWESLARLREQCANSGGGFAHGDSGWLRLSVETLTASHELAGVGPRLRSTCP